MKKQVIREFPNGRKYELTYEGKLEIKGVTYKDSRWISVDTIDGIYDVKDYLCRIPENQKDVNLETLSLGCFKEK